jgi:hypothetical protein
VRHRLEILRDKLMLILTASEHFHVAGIDDIAVDFGQPVRHPPQLARRNRTVADPNRDDVSDRDGQRVVEG